MVEWTIKNLFYIFYVVPVKMAFFIFQDEFVILDFGVDFQISIILDRSFLEIGRALADIELGQMRFRLNDEQVIFIVCLSIQ